MMRRDVKVGAETRGGGIFQCRQRLVIGEFGGTMISLALSPRASPFGDDEGKEVELILLMVLVGRYEEDGG